VHAKRSLKELAKKSTAFHEYQFLSLAEAAAWGKKDLMASPAGQLQVAGYRYPYGNYSPP
jgi:hypothetical protein